MEIPLKPPTKGLCVGKTDLFYLPPYRTKDSIEREQKALSLCRACPSREPCLNYALHHEMYGIWGGMNEPGRRAMRKELGIVLDKVSHDVIVR